MMIRCIFDTANHDEHIGETEQNWVGVYKKGTSNEWKNVLRWEWVKDLRGSLIPHDPHNHKYFSYNLADGEYELRFFLNNSYETFASFEFTVNNVIDRPRLSIENQTEEKITFSSTYGKETWIGIYRQHDYKNDWKYVKAWSWVTNKLTNINLKNLPHGDYEVRLFYNNSYKEEKSISFLHSGVDQDN